MLQSLLQLDVTPFGRHNLRAIMCRHLAKRYRLQKRQFSGQRPNFYQFLLRVEITRTREVVVINEMPGSSRTKLKVVSKQGRLRASIEFLTLRHFGDNGLNLRRLNLANLMKCYSCSGKSMAFSANVRARNGSTRSCTSPFWPLKRNF